MCNRDYNEIQSWRYEKIIFNLELEFCTLHIDKYIFNSNILIIFLYNTQFCNKYSLWIIIKIIIFNPMYILYFIDI